MISYVSLILVGALGMSALDGDPTRVSPTQAGFNVDSHQFVVRCHSSSLLAHGNKHLDVPHQTEGCPQCKQPKIPGQNARRKQT